MASAQSDSDASFYPLEGVIIQPADSGIGTEGDRSRYSAEMSDFGDTVDDESKLLSFNTPAGSSISKTGVSWSEAQIGTVDENERSRVGKWFKEAYSKSGSKSAAVHAAMILCTTIGAGSMIYNQCVSGGGGN